MSFLGYSGLRAANLAPFTLIVTTKCSISLRSPTENEDADLRHAGMDGRQVREDASRDIHVNLDSSTPCWNDPLNRSAQTKFSFLRALRALCGAYCFPLHFLLASRSRFHRGHGAS